MNRGSLAGALGIVLGVAAAGCHGGGASAAGPAPVSPRDWPAPGPHAACYALSYGEAGLASIFPRLIALDEGHGGGKAFWYPAPKADTLWRSFYRRGEWSRAERGRVTVSFRAEDAKVTLDLAQQQGELAGRATREQQRPGADPLVRSSTIEGKHVSCPRPPAPA